MNMIGTLVDEIRPYPDLMSMMEQMMGYHIQPEVTSPEPYLSMRAVWFYSKFESVTYTDQNHI
jgi:hypothetical protein